MLQKIKAVIKKIYYSIVKINDSPERVAVGIAIGFFCGIMPGIGPIASLFIAAILKANKAAALLGSIISNTWISIIAFVISIKVGAMVTGLNWREVYETLNIAVRKNDWHAIFRSTTSEVLLTIIVGYFLVSVIISILAGFSALFIAWNIKGYKK